MKNLPIVLSCLLVYIYPVISYSQTGSGTSTDPYTGTVTGNIEWTGPAIYADDLTIAGGATLTISPGDYAASLLIMTGSILTIENGGVFILNPNAFASITSIENNGVMRLESAPNEPGVASLIHYGYSGTGTTEVRLYLSGGTTAGGAYKWHYIAMPFSGVTASSFSTLNLAQYIESLATSTDNYPGWVAYDGYQYSSGAILANTFTTLEMGRGYNYYSASSTTVTLTGNLIYGDLTRNLTYSGSSAFQGYNLIGNPFPSCINWQWLVDNEFTRSVDNAIYFTNNGNIAAYVGGVGVLGGSEFIPPMQGFFVKSAGSTGRVIFNTGSRAHNPDQLRYKKKSTDVSQNNADTISLVRMKLLCLKDSTDLVVRFNKLATSAFDNELDAYIFSRDGGDLNMWTTTANNDYCINGLPFPDNSVEIPVGINMKVSGTFRISSSEIKKLEAYNLTLKDLSTNQTADLKKGEYIEFTAPAGMLNDRFILAVTKSSTAIDDMPDAINDFSIYATDDRTINIRSMSDNSSLLSGSVTVYDLNGRMVLHEDNMEWTGKNDLKQIHIKQGRPGLYLVVVDTGMGRNVKKITLR